VTNTTEAKVYQSPSGGTLPYRFYRTPGAQAAPLLLFLHGAGERGDNNLAQLKHCVADFLRYCAEHQQAITLVAPQCPTNQAWTARLAPGEVHGLTPEPSGPMAMALELVDTLVKDPAVDAKRIYISGISMGGYGTWDAISRRPDFFAAAMPICGGGDPAQAEKFAKLPIWVFHGAADPTVPVERARIMIEAMHKAGAKPGVTEYPGVGHDSWSMTYRNPDVLKWLFEQHRQ